MISAPEVLNKKGYTFTIDYWSLGVCAYELVFGRRPFRGKTNSDLTHSITREHLRFPEDAESKCSREGMQVLRGVCGIFIAPHLNTDLVLIASGSRLWSAAGLQIAWRRMGRDQINAMVPQF